jgi:S1-C subfamily serine protease
VRLPPGSRPSAPAAHDEAPAEERSRSGAVGRRTWLALAAALVVAILVGVIVGLAATDSPKSLDAEQVGTIASDVVTQAIKDQQAAPPTSAVVYQKILPSLVTIETRSPDQKGDSEGLGTGVIVNASGAILTAFHVVDGASKIRVTFTDGTRSSASVVSTDPQHDIAVIAAQHGPEVIVPAVLGGGAQVGEEAYAVGNPLGYVDSLTAGVVSGLERTAETNEGKTLHGLIQFDAAVNPGNSGGPLLNRGGQVIGIVTALANPSRSGFFIGIGFAVPIGTAGGAANAPSK